MKCIFLKSIIPGRLSLTLPVDKKICLQTGRISLQAEGVFSQQTKVGISLQKEIESVCKHDAVRET